jgi:hypothetical protein
MVYRPGHPRGPSHDPNKWIVRTKDWLEFNRNPEQVKASTQRLLKEIEDLIKAEGRAETAIVRSVTEDMGMIRVDCDPAFGRRLGDLPSAEGSEWVVYRYPMGRPGGPR